MNSDGVPGYRNIPITAWDPVTPTDIDEAVDFLLLFHSEHPGAGPIEPRIAAIRAEIAATGTYTHTSAELTFGARVAWRNASRCIGRLYWNSLVVADRRSSRTAEKIFTDLVGHLNIAGGAGKSTQDDAEGVRGHLRPVITVFPAAVPGRPYARIWNEQLIRYAGYRNPDGSIIGDPRYVDFTAALTERGWEGKREPFEVLPIAIETPTEGVRLFELPESAIVEVPIEHPEHRWFAELGMRWHAVPAIANMRLTIGGVNYPAAPFNGWYMGTEIGARNFADAERYNMLPTIAARLGLDMTRETSLWRDRALVELNLAVLWSFEKVGIRISDHHTESRRFLTHVDREERAGRSTPADWSWIVPPMSGGLTPVFHRYYAEADLKPSFYLDPVARDLGRYGRVDVDSGTDDSPAVCPIDHSAFVRGPSPHIPRPRARLFAADPTGIDPATSADGPAIIAPRRVATRRRAS